MIKSLQCTAIEIMIYDKANEGMEELFESLLKRYQIRLVTSIKGGDFIFMFIYCVTSVIKYIWIVEDHIEALLTEKKKKKQQ